MAKLLADRFYPEHGDPQFKDSAVESVLNVLLNLATNEGIKKDVDSAKEKIRREIRNRSKTAIPGLEKLERTIADVLAALLEHIDG